jgi:hypothetical protein
MFARSVNVEIFPGVTCPFPIDRAGTSQSGVAIGQPTAERSKIAKTSATDSDVLEELDVLAQEISRRIRALAGYESRRAPISTRQPPLPLYEPHYSKRNEGKKKK